jgi:hypothetical protein
MRKMLFAVLAATVTIALFTPSVFGFGKPKPVDELKLMTREELVTEAVFACIQIQMLASVDRAGTGAAINYLGTLQRVERAQFGDSDCIDLVLKATKFDGRDADACSQAHEAAKKLANGKKQKPASGKAKEKAR